MKTALLTTALAILALSTGLAEEKKTTTKTTTENADGSTTTETKTTTSTGTVTEYTPGSTFVVKEETGPVSYVYGKTVTYVTKTGKVLTDNAIARHIKAGARVTVHYVADGTRRVINRIIVDDD